MALGSQPGSGSLTTKDINASLRRKQSAATPTRAQSSIDLPRLLPSSKEIAISQKGATGRGYREETEDAASESSEN